MKPEEAYDKVKESKKEVVVPLNNEPTYNTIGCNHKWKQVAAMQVECKLCGLGLYGTKVEDL